MFVERMTVLRAAAALYILAAMPAWAGGAFEAELGSIDKAVGDVKITMMNGDNDGLADGRGLVPHLKTLGKPPARVALVSFYVWDCGNKKESSYSIYGGNVTYRATNIQKRSVDSGEIDALATILLKASIGTLKESFSAVGMQLLTPEEYLDTPAKKEAYGNFKMEKGALGSILGGLQKHAQGDVWQWGSPVGYQLIELTTRGDVKGNDFRLGTTGVGVAKPAVSLGHDLAEALGVDAVVILYNVVQAQKSSINMRGAGLYMFGPNPIPGGSGSLYWTGHQYSGVYLELDDIPFIKTDKKGNATDTDYEGYTIVAGALATRMAQHIKKKTG